MDKKITVLHIDTEKYWRGGQQQTFYLHSGLLEMGIKSILLTPPQSKLHNHCKKNGVTVTPVAMRNEFDLLAVVKIRQLIKSEKVSIVLAHTSNAQTLALFAIKKNSDCKLVVVRRVDFHVCKNFFSKIKYKSSKIEKIISVSGAIKDVLISDGISADKIDTIYDCIDVDRFRNVSTSQDLRKKINIPENAIVVGTVAALTGHKDYPNLLKAAKMVVEKAPHVIFLSLGSGADEEELKKLHSELNLGNAFKFLGFQDEIGQYLKLFDIFVLSSKKEGLGSSILDAMAVGIPVIGTTAGGIPEIINNEIDGLLVEKENSNALAKAILHLALNKDLREKLADAGKTAAQKYSVQNILKQYVKMFKYINR